MILVRKFTTISLCIAIGTFTAQAEEHPAEQIEFFESKIRPVLVKECYGCHSDASGKARGGLRLDTRELSHIGGESGPAVVPGDLDSSLLYNAIDYQDFRMPPRGRLPQRVVDDFKTWIEMGAPDPRETNIVRQASKITPETIAKAKKEFWAYQRPIKTKPPQTLNSRWPESSIDRFILAKLEANQLAPSSDADASTILRRLCFDLIGLPPTREQLEAFQRVYRRNPDQAVAELVDELLKRPQFGERWGRHWLDLVRYAESNGREVNMTFPHAWRYRDWVIDAFNADMPYDQFIQAQLAGDLLPVKTDQEWSQNLIATTFLAIGPKNLSERNRLQFAADVADEQLDVTTRVILGTSVACARCHDHKFDPIPQTDYYALSGIFQNMETFFGTPASQFGSFSSIQNRHPSDVLRLPVQDEHPATQSLSREDVQTLQAQMQQTLAEIDQARRDRRTGDANAQRNFLRAQGKAETLSTKLGSVDQDGRPISFCMGVQDAKNPKDIRLLIRGELDQPDITVQRAFPQVLCGEPTKISSNSSGRLELAMWISDRQNPLTARVMANRVWLYLLGEGIVSTPENFGLTGAEPTHPELLDHLAVELIDSDWSIKSLIRQIATSRVYRISSDFNPKFFELDPDNQLLWRANTRRLDAEAIRDAMLFSAGTLDPVRPRGSEVAKAGYMRVRDGNLVNVGELLTMQGSDMQDQMRDAIRDVAIERFRARRGQGGRQRMTNNPFVRRERPLPNQGDLLDMTNSQIRSVYLPIVRDEEPRSLEVFDFADTTVPTGQRESSNTPNQALYMLNNAFVISQSEAVANRVLSETNDQVEQIRSLFLLVYNRYPTNSELTAIGKFASEFAPSLPQRTRLRSTWTAVAQALFASAEFRYID